MVIESGSFVQTTFILDLAWRFERATPQMWAKTFTTVLKNRNIQFQKRKERLSCHILMCQDSPLLYKNASKILT